MKNFKAVICLLWIVALPVAGIINTTGIQSGGGLQTDTVTTKSTDSEKVTLLNKVKDVREISEAVSFYSGSKLENLPGTNRLTSFAGHLPGLLIMQRDGQPGWENTTLSIRGQNTFGESIGVLRNSPTILIDGYESDISLIDPYDIESITVLKDAASTAIYGLRSGNGVVLINTRRGHEGEIRVNLNSQTSVSQPDRFPDLLGSGTYAELYNEALINDGMAPKYSSEDIAFYRDGSDPLRHPDNNYMDDYLARSFLQTRNNLNISGGNKSVRYYFSMGHLYNTGLLTVEDSENDYNTNTNLNVLNLHGHIDLQATDKLTVSMDIKAKRDKRIQPGNFDSNGISHYLGQMIGTPPNAYPVFLTPDSLGGNSDFRNNFYGQFNRSGYSIWERYYLSGNLDFKYNLDFVKGLSVIGAFDYSTFGDHITNRSKSFAVYEFTDETNNINKLGDDIPMQNTSSVENVNRYFTLEFGLNHSLNIGGSVIESKLIAERRMNEMSIDRNPHWYQGLKGRVDYSLHSTYFVTFVFSYQGSEQFPSENRYGFFPAGSLGWVVSDRDNIYLKLRGSAGITGNDFDSFTGPVYFAYMERYGLRGNFHFGTDVQTPVQRLRKEAEYNPSLTWSKTKKYDIGMDAVVLDNKISVTADYFFERTDDILVGGTPGIFGINYLYPEGVVANKGVEAMVTWNQEFSNDMNLYVSVNGTYASNEIINMNEEAYEYEWQYMTGHSVGSRFGYVFDRFFTENDDFNSLPDQSALGEVIPGSLKYKDLNGDNMIDERDISYLDQGSSPEFWYGFSGGFEYKGLDFNFHFSGVANRTIMYSGDLAYAMNKGTGSVNQWHVDRWQPGDGQNAKYPSLSISNFANNMVPSSFWIADGSFMRLQQVQLGYTFPRRFVTKFRVDKFRLFVNGSNLMTWADVTRIDPAAQNFDGTSYPVSPTFTVGLNVSF